MVSFRELHEPLFKGPTLLMGRIHKYLVTAENIYRKKRNKEPKQIYRWWIKEKERNVDELEEKTKNILQLLEEFREQVEQLKKIPRFESYEDIIQKLKTFTENHSTTINELLSYVEYLNDKDEIALYMLYYWDIWRSDKNDMNSRHREYIPQEDSNFDKYCVEFATGVIYGRAGNIPTYDKIEGDIYGDYYDSVDPEYAGTPDLTRQIIQRTGWEVMKGYSQFFSYIRKCMRKILDKIDEYWNVDYPEVALEIQIRKIKETICSKIDKDIRNKREFNIVLDNLLAIYGSQQQIFLFNKDKDITEEDFHNEVFHILYINLGSKVENHKKVAKGDIDFLIYNYPIDVKVEDKEQELDKIYKAHKDQITYYCYNRKEDVGFLFIYDNTEKTKDYSTKDFDVFEEKEYKIVVLLLRGNFPYPSVIKHKK